MTFNFSNQNFANGMDEVLGWFGINLMASFQDITQKMFGNLLLNLLFQFGACY